MNKYTLYKESSLYLAVARCNLSSYFGSAYSAGAAAHLSGPPAHPLGLSRRRCGQVSHFRPRHQAGQATGNQAP